MADAKCILIACTGSRGDVQPFVALGVGLKERGMRVVLLVHEEYQGFVQDYGLETRIIRGSMETRLRDTREGRDLLNASAFNALSRSKAFFTPLIVMWFEDVAAACEEVRPDFVVLTTFPSFVATAAVEKLNLPFVIAHTVPASPTREFCPPTVGNGTSWFKAMNSIKWSMGEKMAWKMLYRDLVNDLRSKYGVAEYQNSNGPVQFYRERRIPMLYIYSQHVLPRPADWTDQDIVTGALFLPAKGEFTPSPELSAFLEAGEPPVYIGFGSMMNFHFPPPKDAEFLTECAQAVARAGMRVVLSTSGLQNPPSDYGSDKILAVGSVPHDWLFQRCSIIVTHGGAGTTHAALRAGKPTLVIPFGADQPFWGQRVYSLGCGPVPIPLGKVRGAALAEVLSAMQKDTTMAENARRVGEKIAEEDGVGRAVEVILKEMSEHQTCQLN